MRQGLANRAKNIKQNLQVHGQLVVSTKKYDRIVHASVESVGLDGSAYGTHSMRWTQAGTDLQENETVEQSKTARVAARASPAGGVSPPI